MKRVPAANCVLFCLLAASGAALDLTTKWLAFTRVGQPQSKQELWRGVFSFTTSYNTGALWGLMASVPRANLIFAALSVAAGVAILYWLFWHGAARDRMLTLALGFIMAGTIGNCYDRIVWRMVRDFLYFELINWPIFNVADSCLVCGAGILMIHALFAELPHGKSEPALTPVVQPTAEIQER